MSENIVPFRPKIEVTDVAYMIMRFSCNRTAPEVQQDYQLVRKKAIDLETIEEIQIQYAEEIAKEKERTDKGVAGHPLADPWVRMEKYRELYQKAMEGEEYSAKVDGHMVLLKKSDFKTALECLKAARDDTNECEKLILEKWKLGSGSSSPMRTKVHTGIAQINPAS